MVEYGNGVSQGAGQFAGGGQAGTGTTVDVGASVGNWVTGTVHTISTLPPAALAAAVVVIFLGLLVLRRGI